MERYLLVTYDERNGINVEIGTVKPKNKKKILLPKLRFDDIEGCKSLNELSNKEFQSATVLSSEAQDALQRVVSGAMVLMQTEKNMNENQK